MRMMKGWNIRNKTKIKAVGKLGQLLYIYQANASFQTPSLPGPKPGDGDDLVFSGAGSGCDIDDEDECIPVFETGSGGIIDGFRLG